MKRDKRSKTRLSESEVSHFRERNQGLKEEREVDFAQVSQVI